MSATISQIEVNNIKHDIRASKLGSFTVGGTTKPIYLENGKPTECADLLNVERSNINGNIKINDTETTVYTHPNSTITITQNGITKGTFTTNQSGNTTIELTDSNTTYSVATQSANGLMSSNDKIKLDYTNIAYCTCSTAAATAAKSVTLSGNTQWTLQPGAMIIVKFTNTNTASNVTLNVNGTGSKSIWYNNSVYTGTSSTYCGYANRIAMYVYDGTYWVFVTTGIINSYSNASLGQGYGTCSTAASTAAKVVSLSSYSLTTGGIVAVKFTNEVPANATMNINSKGAKAIYYRGKAITAGVINSGDTATFIYNGSQYHLLAVDSLATICDGGTASSFA